MKKRRLIGILLFIIVLLVGVFGIYCMDYYHAKPQALKVLEDQEEAYSINRLEDDTLVFMPKQPKAAMIFYPGGKVQYEAYAPLMAACARKGVAGILVKMPFNLAFFRMNAADGIKERYPEIDHWYLAGHSLGGVAAANYVYKHEKDYEGIVFLASYSAKDLSKMNLKSLSVYGTNDKVLNMDSYKKNLNNFSKDFKEMTIQGGCHAGFAFYGEQKGDGTPAIDSQQQIEETAEILSKFMDSE